MKKLIAFLWLQMFAVCSCQTDGDNGKQVETLMDSISVYSKRYTIEPRKAYRDSLIGFPPFDFTKGNWELRLSFPLKLSDSMEVIILKRKGKEYAAYFYKLGDRADQLNIRVDSISKSSLHLGAPNSGWENFEKKLFSIDFIAIRSQEDIPSYPFFVDAAWYELEAVVDSAYFHSYLVRPQDLTHKIPEAAHFVEGVNLIKKEFEALNKILSFP